MDDLISDFLKTAAVAFVLALILYPLSGAIKERYGDSAQNNKPIAEAKEPVTKKAVQYVDSETVENLNEVKPK